MPVCCSFSPTAGKLEGQLCLYNPIFFVPLQRLWQFFNRHWKSQETTTHLQSINSRVTVTTLLGTFHLGYKIQTILKGRAKRVQRLPHLPAKSKRPPPPPPPPPRQKDCVKCKWILEKWREQKVPGWPAQNWERSEGASKCHQACDACPLNSTGPTHLKNSLNSLCSKKALTYKDGCPAAVIHHRLGDKSSNSEKHCLQAKEAWRP